MDTSLVQQTHETATSSAASKKQPPQPETCVICLEPFTERAVTWPCNHWFDFLCIASWTQHNTACPLCKATIQLLQYDWAGPDDFKTYHVEPRPVTPAKPPAPTPPSWTTAYAHDQLLYHSRPRRPLQQHRRRQRPDPFATAPLEPDQALQRRRAIYQRGLFSLHVGSNARSRFTDISPSAISRRPDLQSKARMWIRRELRVFDFLQPSSSSLQSTPNTRTSHSRSGGGVENTEFLLEYIVAVLRTVEIKGSSGRAQDLLAEFLGPDHAALFLHELEAWLRSPFHRLEDWDRVVQYREPV